MLLLVVDGENGHGEDGRWRTERMMERLKIEKDTEKGREE